MLGSVPCGPRAVGCQVMIVPSIDKDNEEDDCDVFLQLLFVKACFQIVIIQQFIRVKLKLNLA